MDDQPKAALTRTDWQNAAPALAPLVMPQIAKEFPARCDAGSVAVWHYKTDKGEGFLATSVEFLETGPELVLEAIAGTDAKRALKTVLSNARRVGIRSARFETHHPEAVAARYVRETGLERVASIFRAQL